MLESPRLHDTPQAQTGSFHYSVWLPTFLYVFLLSPKSLPLPQMTRSFSPGRHAWASELGTSPGAHRLLPQSGGAQTSPLPTCRLWGAGRDRDTFLSSLASVLLSANTVSDGCEISEDVHKAVSKRSYLSITLRKSPIMLLTRPPLQGRGG